MTSEYHPDRNPEVETARRAYLEARAAAAGRQLEAMGGTEAGDRHAALDREASDAYIRYVDTWSAAYPKAEAEREQGERLSMPEPRPYDLGLTANLDLSWEAIGIAVPSPCDLGVTNDPELGWDDIQPEPEAG